MGFDHWCCLLLDTDLLVNHILRFLSLTASKAGAINTHEFRHQSQGQTIDINNKVALITGAGSGIGQATAIELAKRGARAIALADIELEGLEHTTKLIRNTGTEVLAERIDVSNTEQIAGFFELTERQLGCPNIIHNNAGTICGEPIWPNTPLEKMTQVVSVNLLGVLYGNSIGIEMMAANGGGVIVNTASTAALGPMPTDPVYSGTKAAIVNLTQSCAGLSQSHNIRVNAVLPGMVTTPFIKRTGDGKQPAAWLKPMLGQIPMLSADQIAEGIIQLVLDQSSAGACLVIENPTELGGPPLKTLLPDAKSFYRYQLSR